MEELQRKNLEARETDCGVVVNLPDVLFEFGKADLTSDARVKVRDIAEVLTTTAPGRRVSIEGHTDAIGSEAYNQRVSEHRAERVAVMAKQQGYVVMEDERINPEEVARAVFTLLARHMTAGEIMDVKERLPAVLREL